MKAAPVLFELRRRGIKPVLVHTGQHYDARMSQVFMDELGLPEPDIHLGAGSDAGIQQIATIMVSFEKVCLDQKPDLIIVVGDVNSTLAASLVAARKEIPLAHIEAGLRSFDRAMPEETNRVLTDHLSDLLFTTEESGNHNLFREGISKKAIHFVGNCMIDTLLKHRKAAVKKAPWKDLGLKPGHYALITLHRPSNVDDKRNLAAWVDIINEISVYLPVIFPVHPRTRQRLTDNGLSCSSSVILAEPLPYLSFLGLMSKAKCVLTDSGGIQEETTVLGVPCLTLRENTERPVTVKCGTNEIVGTSHSKILQVFKKVLRGKWKKAKTPPLWDGAAAKRIADVLQRYLALRK